MGEGVGAGAGGFPLPERLPETTMMTLVSGGDVVPGEDVLESGGEEADGEGETVGAVVFARSSKLSSAVVGELEGGSCARQITAHTSSTRRARIRPASRQILLQLSVCALRAAARFEAA